MKIFLTSVTIFITCLSVYAQQQYKSFNDGFNSSFSEFFRHGTGGKGADFTWNFGVNSPTEPGTKILSLKIDPEDKASPWQGPNITAKDFTHFGTYATRIRIPDVKGVQPNVGAVVGFFTYTMDNQLGISEIDFEWLIADPEIIYIGAWTGKDGDLRRIGRTINLAKGIIYNSIYRVLRTGATSTLTDNQNQPEKVDAIEGYNASAQFYTYGFDWYPARIRWWMLHPATNDTVVLWDYQGGQTPDRIPQHPSRYLINFWHTNDWPVHTNSKSVEKPLFPFETEIDWASYDVMKSVLTSSLPVHFGYNNILYQNYPNPFSGTTTIQFRLSEASRVSIVVYNIAGEEVKVLMNEYMSDGIHSLNYDASGLKPGMYFYKIQSEQFSKSLKMVVSP